jgi:hypothetical protein
MVASSGVRFVRKVQLLRRSNRSISDHGFPELMFGMPSGGFLRIRNRRRYLGQSGGEYESSPSTSGEGSAARGLPVIGWPAQ